MYFSLCKRLAIEVGVHNQTSSVNLSGNNFYIRDETDIRSLAVEIATLTKRQQHGKGMRVSLA